MEQQAAEMQKIMEQINQMKGAAAETTVAAGVAATTSAFKPAQPAVKRFCSNCGAPRGNGKFCSKCGKPL
jgi:membrane protease subunit (stomatin/prohibitin family)